MQTEPEVLMVAAITIECLHTVTGPDHYLAFIALSKSRAGGLAATSSGRLFADADTYGVRCNLV